MTENPNLPPEQVGPILRVIAGTMGALLKTKTEEEWTATDIFDSMCKMVLNSLADLIGKDMQTAADIFAAFARHSPQGYDRFIQYVARVEGADHPVVLNADRFREHRSSGDWF